MTEHIPPTPSLLDRLAFAATEAPDPPVQLQGRLYQYRDSLIHHADLEQLQFMDLPEQDWPNIFENFPAVSPVTLRHVTLSRFGIHLLIPWNQSTQAIADSSHTRLITYDPDYRDLNSSEYLNLRLDLPDGWQQIQNVCGGKTCFFILQKKLTSYKSQVHTDLFKGYFSLHHLQSYGGGRNFQIDLTEWPDGRSELQLCWVQNHEAVFVIFDASGRPTNVHIQSANMLLRWEEFTQEGLQVIPSLLRGATQPEHHGSVYLPGDMQIAIPVIHRISPTKIPTDAWAINYEATLENYFTASQQPIPPDPQSAIVWQLEPFLPNN